MNVLHLIDSLEVGGAEKLLVTFALQARARGIRVTVASLRETPESPILEELTALGIRVLQFPGANLFTLARIQALLRFFKAERFDIIHTHLTYANILGTLCGRILGIPVVATLHSEGVEEQMINTVRQGLEHVILRLGAKKVHAVGYSVADAHRKWLGKKQLVVIQNAVPVAHPLKADKRTCIRQSILDDSSRPMIIAVGRMVEPKGYPELIQAAAILRRTHSRAAVVIAGSGDMFDEIQGMIKAQELEDMVFLLGYRADTANLLASADLFVLSSRWEGLPLSVLEGMMAGLPIVGTRVGDMPYIVPPSAGVLVPPQDPPALAAALAGMLSDPQAMVRMGRAARAHALAGYAPEQWMDSLLNLYCEIKRCPGAQLDSLEQTR